MSLLLFGGGQAPANYTAPVRLDRLRAGLYAALTLALAPVVISWGRGNPARDALPAAWCSLQVLSGPSPHKWSRARGWHVPRIDDATITIAPVAPAVAIVEGDAAIVEVNKIRFRYDVGAGDTPEIVRDALLSALAGEPGIVAVPLGSDSMTLVPMSLGGLWHVSGAGVASADVADSGEILSLTAGLYMMRIELQAFGRPPMDAQSLAAGAQHALLTDAVSEHLREYGIGLGARNAAITDLSAIAGGYWESRAAFVFEAIMLGATARPIDPIENVQGRIAASIDGVVVDVDFSF